MSTITVTNPIFDQVYRVQAWEDNNRTLKLVQGEGIAIPTGATSVSASHVKAPRFQLRDKRGVIDLSADPAPIINWAVKRPQGGEDLLVCNIVVDIDAGITAADGVIEVPITTSVTEYAGDAYGEIRLITSDGVLKFFGINACIGGGVSDDASIKSSGFSALIAALQETRAYSKMGVAYDKLSDQLLPGQLSVNDATEIDTLYLYKNSADTTIGLMRCAGVDYGNYYKKLQVRMLGGIKPQVSFRVLDYTGSSTIIGEWTTFASLSDLSNKADKSTTLAGYGIADAYTKSQVDNLISAISTIRFEVVTTLPTTDIQTNVIYLVPAQTATTQNVYDEYIYTNNNWELIGGTAIDLSQYAKKSELPTAAELAPDMYDELELDTYALLQDDGIESEYKKSVPQGQYYYTSDKKKIGIKISKASPSDAGLEVVETYSDTEIDAKIAAISSLSFEVVQTKPTQNIKTNVIYLIPNGQSGTDNIYDEWIYVNNKWELIGSTVIDLSQYAKKSELPTKTSDLTNDSGFLTQHQDISGKENVSNKVTSIDMSADNTHYPSAMAVKEYVDSAAAEGFDYVFVNEIPADADHAKKYVLPDGYIYEWHDGTPAVIYDANTTQYSGTEAFKNRQVNIRPTVNQSYTNLESQSGVLTSGLIPFSTDWRASGETVRAQSEVVISGLSKIVPAYNSSVFVYFYRADGSWLTGTYSKFLTSLKPAGASSRGSIPNDSEITLPLSMYLKDSGAGSGVRDWNNVGFVRILIGVSKTGDITEQDIANVSFHVPYYDSPGTEGSWVSTGVKHPYYTTSEKVFDVDTDQVLYAVGDSITYGYVGDGVPRCDSWVKYVIDHNGYDAVNSRNLGESGIGFCCTYGGRNAMDVVNDNNFSAADIVTVALGINDWKSLEKIYTLTEFYTAMYGVFSKIRSDNPWCRIYFILPFNGKRAIAGSTQADGSEGIKESTFYWLNTKVRADYGKTYCAGYTLLEFIGLIKAKFTEADFKALNVEIVDMVECPAINRHNMDVATVDGLHPSAETHAELGKEIARRIVLM